MNLARRRRRIAISVTAPAALFGLVAASAASLGGVTGPSLGADVTAVSSCDTDGVTLGYTNTYDATLGRYQTTSVAVSGINAACAGLTVSVTLKDNASASLSSGSATAAGTSATITLAGAGAEAKAVVGAAVLIT